MGIYGVDFYGVAKFGRDPSLYRPDFSVEPFQSTPLDYSTLRISWTKPQSLNCTYLQLIRNIHNLPQDETDGMAIFNPQSSLGSSGPGGSDANSIPVGVPPMFVDTGPQPGFNYYTMWGWDSVNNVWVHCSDLIALLPLQWGYGYRLYSLLPYAYRDRDTILVDPYNPWPENTQGQPPLQRYLNLLGFQMDFIRTELESLMSINDAQRCSGALLPLLAYQFGLPNEPEIGMQQERQLVLNAVHLYKLKGSPRGITDLSSILTGYPATSIAHKGYNLMLTLDDSVMANSTGTWQASPPPGTHWAPIAGSNIGLAIHQVANLMSVPNMTDPTGIIGFTPNPPPYTDTGMSVSVTTAGDIVITTGALSTLDFLSSTDGAGNITFTIQIFSPVSRTVELTLWGDAGTGSRIAIGSAVTSPSVVNAWHQITVTATVDPFLSLGNPSSLPVPQYYWIYPRVRIESAAANELHYLTFGMIWACEPEDVGNIVPTYDYPRDIKINLAPQASNLLTNPLTSFINPLTSQPMGFDGWTPAADPMNPTQNYTTPLAIHYQTVDDPPGLFAVNGDGSLVVSPTGPNNVVWAGLVNTFSTPGVLPTGWFADPNNDWFNGAAPGPGPSRLWFDPSTGWFTMNGAYFSVGTQMVGGSWFAQPQPTLYGNCQPFIPFPGQNLNFSVYARYMTVAAPSNAVMQIGFRWYFPDGTYTDDNANSITVPLTDTWARYSYPPDNANPTLGQPPVEPGTGVTANRVFPFVKFPAAQNANFLLNSAMLSPTQIMPKVFLDSSLPQYSGNSDYTVGSSGASYYYRGLTARSFRLRAELYRWIPMGSTYTVAFMAANVEPPLDPTLW